MEHNILVTGAAGFIGGTVLATLLLQSSNDAFKTVKLWAAVRTKDQAEALSGLKVQVLQLDLKDADAVTKAIVSNNIDIVIHTATVDLSQASTMVKALGEVRRASGRDVFFFNPGITSMFSKEGGWPYGPVKDTDPVFELEKEIGRHVPVRAASIGVIEIGQESHVKTLNIPIPALYGRGQGLVKQISIPIPYQVRTAIATGRVRKFEKQGIPPTVHVQDLADLYVLLAEKILLNEPITTGEKGYYFPVAHKWPWWAVLQAIANSLHSRGLIDDPTVQTWSDWDTAARALDVPRLYIEPMLMSGGELVPVNSIALGWQPKWDEESFLKNIDQEVQDALDLDKFKPTGYDAFMND